MALENVFESQLPTKPVVDPDVTMRPSEEEEEEEEAP